MSYLALARKWRPRTFSQLVGQEPINKALINALNQQRLHHAYLFTGTRGVGKTSIARILAKSLNCEIGISAKPCLECNACTAIEQGRFIDLIEVDGASKTRVEDTRDLLDNVQYAPTNGRFKIYLIDEVHMLSQHSFNALLKTLEEPPAHVKFILATTDPQKLPVTVLSRCLQFHLRHLPAELISKHLQWIMNEEHLDFETQALDILAFAARGSMRDALSLLDQAITGCDTQLKSHDVKMILGYTQQDYAIQLIQALSAKNAQELLSISQKIAIEGGYFHYVLDEILNYLHQIAVQQNIGDANTLIIPTKEVKNLAQQLSPEDIQLFYQIGIKGREEIHLAPTAIIGFNMTLLRMFTFRPETEAKMPSLIMTPQNKTSATELVQETTDNYTVESINTIPLINLISDVPPPQEEYPLIELTTKAEDALLIMDTPQHKLAKEKNSVSSSSDWASIIPKLKLTGLSLNAIENAEFVSRNGQDLILRVAKGHQSLFTPTILTRIEAALSNYYQNSIKITLNSEQSVHSSPAQKKEQTTQEKQKKAEAALKNDPVFQQLQQDFSAELVKNSIVPMQDDL